MPDEERSVLDKEGAHEEAADPVEAGGTAGEERIASESDEDEDEAGPGEADPRRHQDTEGPAPLYHKAPTLNRAIARIIDILIALLLARLPDYIGFFAGITYVGIADGLTGGRSIGKRVIGLRVLYAKDGRHADLRASMLRNSPMALLYVLYLIPFVGWILAGLGLGFELLLVIGSPEGKRIGDEVAGTVVVDEANT